MSEDLEQRSYIKLGSKEVLEHCDKAAHSLERLRRHRNYYDLLNFIDTANIRAQKEIDSKIRRFFRYIFGKPPLVMKEFGLKRWHDHYLEYERKRMASHRWAWRSYYDVYAYEETDALAEVRKMAIGSMEHGNAEVMISMADWKVISWVCDDTYPEEYDVVINEDSKMRRYRIQLIEIPAKKEEA